MGKPACIVPFLQTSILALHADKNQIRLDDDNSGDAGAGSAYEQVGEDTNQT